VRPSTAFDVKVGGITQVSLTTKTDSFSRNNKLNHSVGTGGVEGMRGSLKVSTTKTQVRELKVKPFLFINHASKKQMQQLNLSSKKSFPSRLTTAGPSRQK